MNSTSQPLHQERAQTLFRMEEQHLHRRVDLMFAKLMIFQWLAGIVAAEWISPRTWAGASSTVHWHVLAAIFLGGAIFSFPLMLVWRQPGSALTRHVIGVAEMLFAGLLIHLTGGRIESHFQIFGALAFLAFYRDWKVLITATAVTAADHFLRGAFWPQSAYGVLAVSPWRWFEHAGWVIYEDIFLIASIRQALKDAFKLAERQASLEAVNASIEQKIVERTAELTKEIAERKRAEAEREQLNRELVDASRRAGMAEVATSVLHNVGNVLNSVNVSGALIADKVNRSKVANLTKATAMLRENEPNLAGFLTTDERGKKLPGYLSNLATHLVKEQEDVAQEVGSLMKNIVHIKEIVAMQQNYAKASGIQETLSVSELVEDAVRMNNGSIERHQVKLVREFAEVAPISTDKHKVLQILINLIRNAKHACDDSGRDDKQIILRIANGDGRIKISVLDNGVGIPAENLTKIFNHGFTTRKSGHGFGLHSGAIAAKEMGGSLKAQSDGPGCGAVFTLELPVQYPNNN